VTDDFQGRWHFNTCIAAIMELVNDANRRAPGTQSTENPVTAVRGKGDEIPLTLLADVQRNLALLLAPFAPYLAHELWEVLGEKENLLKAAWPNYDPALVKEEEIEMPVQINGKVRSHLVVPADVTQEVVLERALADEKIRSLTAGKQIVKKIFVPGKLVNIVVK
jgi:leucyl-tRNA synthetase